MKIPIEMPFVKVIYADRFWIIGDVHGMYNQFKELLWKIYNYEQEHNGKNYVIISIGDICDRGDQSYRTFQHFRDLRTHGVTYEFMNKPTDHDIYYNNKFYNIMGNHDEKLLRALTGSKVQPKHGLDVTLEEIKRQASPSELKEMIKFLQTTPLTLKLFTPPVDYLNDEIAVVVHASFHDSFYGYSDMPWNESRTMQHAIYGPVRSVSPEGKPDRIDWENDYNGKYYVFYGHKIVGDTPKFSKKACGLDTGCFQSGILTAVSYPEMTVLHVTGKPSSIIIN